MSDPAYAPIAALLFALCAATCGGHRSTLPTSPSQVPFVDIRQSERATTVDDV
jgi:hypothetical protein